MGGILAATTQADFGTEPGNPSALLVFSWVVLALLVWLCAWPFFAARLQQIVWGHTHWGVVRFAGQMRFWPLCKLVTTQMLLVLLSCGLYWPFAAVNIARYRIQALMLTADEPLGEVLAQSLATGDKRASGDAAAEFFGLDLGW